VEGQKKDLVFQEYRREHKRRFAWIKAGKISEEDFAAWVKQAKAKNVTQRRFCWMSSRHS